MNTKDYTSLSDMIGTLQQINFSGLSCYFLCSQTHPARDIVIVLHDPGRGLEFDHFPIYDEIKLDFILLPPTISNKLIHAHNTFKVFSKLP